MMYSTLMPATGGARNVVFKGGVWQRGSRLSTWKRAGAGKRGLAATPILSLFKFGAPKLPEVVEAGDPVLNEGAAPVLVNEITSQHIQRIMDDMICVMRAAPGVGLAAPQLGISLQIIVLEDTKEYISYVQKEETDAQQRYPFDLLVICNPTLKKRGTNVARFFEGCLSINGYRGLVERHLEVEVSGYGRDGLPIKVEACGWQARILQHECDHLNGVLYVDKMISKSFRTASNLRLPLPPGCPKPGVYNAPQASRVLSTGGCKEFCQGKENTTKA